MPLPQRAGQSADAISDTGANTLRVDITRVIDALVDTGGRIDRGEEWSGPSALADDAVAGSTPALAAKALRTYHASLDIDRLVGRSCTATVMNARMRSVPLESGRSGDCPAWCVRSRVSLGKDRSNVARLKVGDTEADRQVVDGTVRAVAPSRCATRVDHGIESADTSASAAGKSPTGRITLSASSPNDRADRDRESADDGRRHRQRRKSASAAK